MLSGSRASVAVKIFGDDLLELRLLAEQARQALAAIPGVVDLAAETQTEIPVLSVRFDRSALARHGLSVDRAADVLAAAYTGLPVSRVDEGQVGYDLVVQLDREGGWTTETVGEAPVALPGGGHVPLGAVAHIERRREGPQPHQSRGGAAQDRGHLQRGGPGHNLGGGRHQIGRRPIGGHPDGLPRGVRGAVRERFAGRPSSGPAGPRRHRGHCPAPANGLRQLAGRLAGHAEPAPGAHGGSGWGLLVRRVLSIAAIIGFITVFGIATRNGIMLVSHIRHLQLEEGGTELAEAVRRGARERLAPILMTALASGLALVPLALAGDQPGSEIQTPMAQVILCGLLSSMVLNMLITPGLYLRFGRPVHIPENKGDSS